MYLDWKIILSAWDVLQSSQRNYNCSSVSRVFKDPWGTRRKNEAKMRTITWMISWQVICLLLSRIISILKNIYLCIWEWEKERGRDRGRERIPTRSHAISTEPDAELEPTNWEIMTWTRIRSRTLNWLSHPGTPNFLFNNSWIKMTVLIYINQHSTCCKNTVVPSV